MKKIMLTLIAILTLTVSARAMSYEQARNEALFLTDKMAYELNLTDAQYEAAYEINLDYLMGVTSRHDVFGSYWERRNADIQYILYSWQWDLFRAATYFYRPLYWNAGYWHFGIYARYPHRDYFYFGRPHFYVSYRGGHSWRMNGGRSYYVNHRNHFRPDIHRDHHVGMRDGWNRGDYRNNHKSSSTRITGNTANRTTFGSRQGNSESRQQWDNRQHHGNNATTERHSPGSSQQNGQSSNRTAFGTRQGSNSSIRSISPAGPTARSIGENKGVVRNPSSRISGATPATRSSAIGTRAASMSSRAAASMGTRAASTSMRSSGGSNASSGGHRSSGSFGRHR